MCELLAMSSHTPAAVTYSLEEFSKNGSRLRHNRDGWGIALARDKDAVLVKEPAPAANSIWVRFIAENAIETTLAIAHVRYATRGQHTMENTHPFRRVLGARTHLFAHNGTLTDIDSAVDRSGLAFTPIGNTDSELAFCVLLSRLKPLYDCEKTPSLDSRLSVFREVCSEMKQLGPCNFLYHDGDVLFVHAHKRVYDEGGRHTEPKSPGLNIKKCWTCAAQKEVSCPGLNVGLQDEQTVLIASVPLDENGWEALDEGTVLAVSGGQVLACV